MLKKLFFSSVATLLAVSALAQVELKVDVSDGQAVSGNQVFRVTVTAKNPVTQVEFYVGDDLRETDTSTPYEFKVDTLAFPDGPVKVTFAAYTSEGESSRKVLTLNVDNGTSKGAQFHVDRANALIRDSKWDEAMAAARVALKISAGDKGALMVMARAAYGKGVLDVAQKYAEDALAADAGFLAAHELLAAIHLKRTFATATRGSDRTETLNLIKQGLFSAIKARRQVLDAGVEAFGAVTDANLVRYADVCIAAGRYSKAIEKLAPVFSKSPKNTQVADRLIYAQIRSARLADAVKSMEMYRKFGSPEALGYALQAILFAQFDDQEKASDALKEAIQSDGEDLGVRTTQAYLALRQTNTGTLTKLASDLVRDHGELTVSNYYLSIAYYRGSEYEYSRDRFERSVLAEPCNYDMYVERGNEALTLALSFKPDLENRQQEVEYQYKVARAYFEAALEARAESFEALTGLSLLSLIEKKVPEAIRLATAATTSGPGYAAAHYALSAALGEAARNSEAKKAVTSAEKLDKAQLEGRGIPDAITAYAYYSRYGRVPLLVVPAGTP